MPLLIRTPSNPERSVTLHPGKIVSGRDLMDLKGDGHRDGAYADIAIEYVPADCEGERVIVIIRAGNTEIRFGICHCFQHAQLIIANDPYRFDIIGGTAQ